ncbi:hypothetical protein G3I60_15880 [Streptomyces sp. SID13666]|nr:hypothetical protein [Streptomyces sp. SID13666]
MWPQGLRASPLPDPDVVYRPSRRDIDPASGDPRAYTLWGRHEWRTQGECWLWCGREDVDVTWIGPVQSSGMHAALFSCRACLYELDQRVLLVNMRKDQGAMTARAT